MENQVQDPASADQGRPFAAQHDYLLIRPLADQDSTSSGILLAGNVNVEVERGEVVSSGPGSFQNGTWVPTRAKAGDIVYYALEVATGIAINTEPLKIIRDTHVVLTNGNSEVDNTPGTLRSVTHISVGDRDWSPTKEQIEEVKQDFLTAQVQPGGVFATRNGVVVSTVYVDPAAQVETVVNADQPE
ncbi:10 kDa chaperonin [compost metagenome]